MCQSRSYGTDALAIFDCRFSIDDFKEFSRRCTVDLKRLFHPAQNYRENRTSFYSSHHSGNKKLADPKVVSPDKLFDGPARGSNIGLVCELFSLSGIRLLLNFLYLLSTIPPGLVKGKKSKK